MLPVINRPRSRILILFVVAAILAAYGVLGPAVGTGVGAHDLMPSAVATEAQEVFGDGVVGGPQSAWPLTDLVTVARWKPG